MSSNAPFDVWDGEGLDRPEPDEMHAAEEVAMRVRSVDESAPWSDLTEDLPDEERPPVHYFEDEQPEGADPGDDAPATDEHEPDLEELLEHQHYAFPEEHQS